MSHPDYIHVKDIIRYKLFPILRKRGFVARMNFSCCASCASYELAQVAKDRGMSKIVFYHKQTGETFKKSGKVYLNYFSMTNSNLDKLEIGNEISNAVKACGLNVIWNGDEDTTIQVTKNGN